MSNRVIERDQNEQKKFGHYLESFANETRTSCRKVKNYITEAQDNMKDDSAQRAVSSLIETIDEIEKMLPEIEEFGTRQITKAKQIQDAENMRFSVR